MDSFSIPLFAAALLALLALLAALRWLPESLATASAQDASPAKKTIEKAKVDSRTKPTT